MSTEEELKAAQQPYATVLSVDELIEGGRIKNRKIPVNIADNAHDLQRLRLEIQLTIAQLERAAVALDDKRMSPEDRLLKADTIIYYETPMVIKRKMEEKHLRLIHKAG